MQQRVLLASALVLGCVTAAGVGGFLAVRQMAPTTPDASTPVASQPIASTADPAEGTVADVLPSPAPEPAAASGALEVAAPRPNAVRSTPAPAAAPAPARTRAAAVPAPRGDAGANRRPSMSSTPAPDPPPMPRATPEPAQEARDTTPRDRAPRDTWPSRDSGTTSDDRWASRDPGAGGPGADTLPSRASVNETTAPPPPVRRLENVTIPANAVIGIQIENGVSTTTARVEDPVRARVTRDLLAGGDVVVPAGARLLGNVTLVEEGGRVKERARLGIRFHTLVLANGTEIKLPTETIYRDGESVAGRSTAKIGGAAIGGAILGAIMGGGKGAIIGAASGAGSGTGWAMAGDRKPAELRAGQSLTVRMSDSVTTQVER
jgi:hypothetical protein